MKANKFNIFTIITFTLFGFIFWHLAKNMLQIKPDGWYVGHINLYGDLLIHLAFINKFLESNKILVSSPIFALDKPNYPIFADFITAQIAKITSVDFALFSSTFIAGILVIFVARLFIIRFIKNEAVVFLTLCLFLLNGGFGFYYFFQDFLTSQTPFSNFILNLPRQYTDLKDYGYWWINNFLAYFLPQRGFLFAFPITLIILLVLYVGTSKHRRKYFFLAAILAGILPLVQAHSLFLIFLLSIFFAPATIFFSRNKKEVFLNWLIFSLITISLALPIFHAISSAQNPFKFIRFDPGWTSEENIIWFWLKNLGLFAPALTMALIWLFKKNRFLFILYIPFLMIFFLSNIFVFQPWNFDNSKILIYWYFVSAIVVAYFVHDQFFTEVVIKKLAGTILILLMTFSGSLDILRTFTPVTNYQIFSRQDLEVAQSVKNLTPRESIFLTASNHTHPIPALTGRSTLLGFHGWVWSHGLDYAKRAGDIQKIYLGGQTAEELIAYYQINFITIGPQERADFAINENYFNKYPKIILSNNWQIYDVTNLWNSNNEQD